MIDSRFWRGAWWVFFVLFVLSFIAGDDTETAVYLVGLAVAILGHQGATR